MAESLLDRFWRKLKSAFLRITVDKTTVIFFLFTFLHCFAQGIIQAVLYSADYDEQSLTASILSEGQVPTDKTFPWLTRQGEDFTLQLCSSIPISKNQPVCQTIFETGNNSMPIPSGFRRRSTDGDVDVTRPRGGANQGTIVAGNKDADGTVTVNVTFPDGQQEVLSEQCTRVLSYADSVLRNSQREELALVGSEFWLLGLSSYAVLRSSIPHLLAGLFMRILSTGWSLYAIWRTQDIAVRFSGLITNGPCGFNLFPGYATYRTQVQIADIVLNVCSSIVSASLVWVLVKRYSTASFNRVGAPAHIIRAYKFYLCMLVCLQMAVYLFIGSTGLWIDQLFNSALTKISTHTPIYVGLFLFTIIVLIPWISLGWYSVRREKKRPMLAFLLIDFVFFTAWAIMYYSEVYRWTWIQWPFFASLTACAQVIMAATIVIGTICWRQFGNGLAHYLHVEKVLSRMDFEPEIFQHDVEKNDDKDSYIDGFSPISIHSLHYEAGKVITHHLDLATLPAYDGPKSPLSPELQKPEPVLLISNPDALPRKR